MEPVGSDIEPRKMRRGLVAMTARGPMLPVNGCFASIDRREQSRMRAGRGASLRRSALRTDCPAVRGLVARRRTRCIRCAHCVQTTATSQLLMRAARAATSPVLLGASQARRHLPARAFAETAVAFATGTKNRGLRGGRCPVGAIWVATSSAGPGSARAQRVLRDLTRRGCLSAMSAANAASSATRPRTEQRSAVGAQRRPPPHEPPPGCARRDAPTCQQMAAMGRKQTTKPRRSH